MYDVADIFLQYWQVLCDFRTLCERANKKRLQI